VNSFTPKRLRVTFILAGTNQVFPGTGNNKLVLEPNGLFTGMRVQSRVEAVARLATQMDLKIYGMKKPDMDALTVAWANPPVVLDHLVILEANNGNGWTQVFSGTIKEAQPVYRAQPGVFFQVLAVTGYFQKINPVPPTSYPEIVDIGVAAPDIIAKMGGDFAYIDGGATGVLNNPYFWGTAWDQLKQACVAAKADFYVLGKNILVVPQGQPRKDAPAVILNKGSGLVGQPEYSGAGLEVTALFDPAFATGTPLEIQGTNLPAADGRWFPIKLQHQLDAVMKGGKWFTFMQCLRVLV
jgi:hypothetical protein